MNQEDYVMNNWGQSQSNNWRHTQFSTDKVMLMGVPTLDKVEGLSQAGAIHDWLSHRDTEVVFFSSFGNQMKLFLHKVQKIRDNILNDPTNSLGLANVLFGGKWPQFLNTVSADNTGIINYQEKIIPMFPIDADVVIVLTNSQYRRQMKKNPQKLAWKQWYDARNIPVLFMNEQGIFDTN